MTPHQPRIDRLIQLIRQEEKFIDDLTSENMKDINALMLTSVGSPVEKELARHIDERKRGIARTKSLITRYKNELKILQKSPENPTFNP